MNPIKLFKLIKHLTGDKVENWYIVCTEENVEIICERLLLDENVTYVDYVEEKEDIRANHFIDSEGYLWERTNINVG